MVVGVRGAEREKLGKRLLEVGRWSLLQHSEQRARFVHAMRCELA